MTSRALTAQLFRGPGIAVPGHGRNPFHHGPADYTSPSLGFPHILSLLREPFSLLLHHLQCVSSSRKPPLTSAQSVLVPFLRAPMDVCEVNSNESHRNQNCLSLSKDTGILGCKGYRVVFGCALFQQTPREHMGTLKCLSLSSSGPAFPSCKSEF